MSYDNLMEQMLYAGFTEEQAQHGIDSCNADWNQEALDAAKSYQRSLNMNTTQVEEQLAYNHFTQEQIQYALDNLN